MTVFYINATASGLADGTSYVNAANLTSLDAVLALCSPGDEVWLEPTTHARSSLIRVELFHGGSSAANVVIRGANSDGVPAPAEIRQDRTDPWVKTGSVGQGLFKVQAGANYLTFRDIKLRNLPTFAYLNAANTGMVIERVHGHNVGKLVDNLSGAGLDVVGLRIRECSLQGATGFLARLYNDGHDIVIEDCVFDGQRQDDGTSGSFATGVSLQGTVHDVTVRRSTFRNGADVQTYWNGDGVAAESTNYNILLEDLLVEGWPDGGIDVKSSSTTLRRIRSRKNKMNFRFHNGTDFRMEDCVSFNPLKTGGTGTVAHVELSSSAQVLALRSRFESTAAVDTVVNLVGSGCSFTQHGGKVRYHPSATLDLIASGSTVTRVGVDVATAS